MNLVSIICPTYNSESYIEAAIQSVRNQTYSNWELLITDDCSTDSSYDIIQEEARKDTRIKTFQLERNMGADASRNNSIIQANGRFISFIDSDDIWLPEKLARQIAFMTEHDLDLCYSAYYAIDHFGYRTGRVVPAKPQLNYFQLLRNNYIGCSTAIYDTRRLGKVCMPNIKKRQDWALWLKIAKMTDRIMGIAEPLAEYRVHGKSISNNKLKLLKYNWMIYRNVEGFSIPKSSLQFARFFFFFVLKKIGIF